MSDISRREALGRSLVVLAAVPAAIAACKKSGSQLSCTDTTGLSPTDAATRTTFNYADHSPDPNKKCARCQLFQAAAPNTCGGCTLVKGPINPDGSCNAYVARPA